MCWLVEFHEVVRTYGLVLGGVFALAIAAWRSWVSARNLGLERYKVGAELLDGKIHGHTARISGATVLGEYGKFSRKKHRQVMTVFEAFLTHPPRFGGNHGLHMVGSVDYESRDTQEVIRIINGRNKLQRKWHQVELPSISPYLVNVSGDVEVNQKHEEHQKWQEATGAAFRDSR